MPSFATKVCCPVTDELVPVEVFYRVADIGVVPERPKMRVFITSVAQESQRDDGAPWELMGQLDGDTMLRLVSEAADYQLDEADLDRFGSEAV